MWAVQQSPVLYVMFVLRNVKYEFREQTFIHVKRTEARFELQNLHFNEVHFKALNNCYYLFFLTRVMSN